MYMIAHGRACTRKILRTKVVMPFKLGAYKLMSGLALLKLPLFTLVTVQCDMVGIFGKGCLILTCTLCYTCYCCHVYTRCITDGIG